MADTNPFSWQNLIIPGAGMAASLIGNRINAGPAKAQVQESKRQFDIKNTNAMQARNMLLPNLQASLGQPGGGFTSGRFGAPAQSAPTPGGQSPLKGALLGAAGGALGAVLPSLVKGTAGKLLGAAVPSLIGGGGTGAGAFGVGALGGPIGMAAMAAPFAIEGIKKLLNPAHKQANKLTGDGGIQSTLNNQLTQLSQQGLPPDQFNAIAVKLFDNAANQGMNFAQQGGDQAKVVKQMLGSYNWNPALAAESQKYLGMGA